MTNGELQCPSCGGGGGESSEGGGGDLQVGCRGNGNHIHRYDALRDVLFSAAQSAALAPRKKVLSLIPGTCSCPTDIFTPNWSRGWPAALDVNEVQEPASVKCHARS